MSGFLSRIRDSIKQSVSPKSAATGGLAGAGADWGRIKDQFGGGGMSSGTPIGDMYASLNRDQWDTYVKTFVPIENKLIEYASSPSVVTDAMNAASKDVTGAFDAQQGETQRRLKGLGVTLSGEEQQSAAKSFGLAKSLADVNAQNNARDLTINRQASILGNPAPEAIRI